MNPLDIPDDAKSYGQITTGSRTIEGEGLKLSIWTGLLTGQKGEKKCNKTVHMCFLL